MSQNANSMQRSRASAPLPVYLLLIGVIALFVASGKFPSDLTIIIAVLSVGGFSFMELGRRVPLIGSMDIAAIMAFVVPSAMVHFGWIPTSVAGAINGFVKTSNFLYLYIAAVIAGSILSMDRQVLIAGFLKIFIPLAVGSICAAIVGTLVGCAVGMSATHTFFMVVVPIMSGGLGEGAIPLSIGYALITKAPEAQLFGQVIPVVMLSGFTAILLCGLLNLLGKRYPALTGQGALQSGDQSGAMRSSRSPVRIDPAGMAAAVTTMMLFYLIGVLAQRWWEFTTIQLLSFLLQAPAVRAE
ncbi:2-hydroxycarboxylate transporter family protein [Paraburkholderia flagellata]|uniref:2-hydroxycarboxylate transporter family protein n=1 Tax=Paraburkholderia flagellata TaxID=2883241 RepID=UPI001F3171C7|nr:2-hydroxycarboxylate transporter family protein [Paraburkholderia flagellata]